MGETPIGVSSLPPFEVFDALSVMSRGKDGKHAPLAHDVAYGLRFTDGSPDRYGCGSCADTYSTVSRVMYHRRSHTRDEKEVLTVQPTIPGTEVEIIDPPVRPVRGTGDPRIDEQVVIAGQILSNVIDRLVAQRDEALAEVEPLRAQVRTIDAELRIERRARKAAESGLDRFMKTAARIRSSSREETE